MKGAVAKLFPLLALILIISVSTNKMCAWRSVKSHCGER